MGRPLWLIAILAAVIIIAIGVLVLGTDVLVKYERFGEAGYLNIREVDVKPERVTSAEVELNVTAYINHEGAKSKNASMLLRAINAQTGLLATQASREIAEVEGSKTLAVSKKIIIPRERGYDIRILLFDSDRIADSGVVSIRGLEALIPGSHRSGVEINGVDFIARNVTAGAVRIQADIYLENRASTPSESLQMLVKARQAESNLLADKVWIETGEIRNETTVIKEAALTVPDGYNYIIEAMLWKKENDILLGKWEKPLLLAPTRTLPEEAVEKKLEIEVSKFVREEGLQYPMATPAPALYPTPAPRAPGFESIFAVISLISGITLIRRLSHGRRG